MNAIITSHAARNTRAIRATAIATARIFHYSKVAYATLAPIVKTTLVFTLLLIIAIAVIALNWLTTADAPKNLSNTNEVAQPTENIESLAELFQQAEKISKKYETFGDANEQLQSTENFSDMNVSELRKIAQSRKIQGARKARKTELLTMLAQTH